MRRLDEIGAHVLQVVCLLGIDLDVDQAGGLEVKGQLLRRRRVGGQDVSFPGFQIFSFPGGCAAGIPSVDRPQDFPHLGVFHHVLPQQVIMPRVLSGNIAQRKGQIAISKFAAHYA